MEINAQPTKKMNTAIQSKFNSSFDRFACEGDTIEANIDGFTITARIVRDDDANIDDDDAHNPDQAVTGCDDEQQEKLLDARRAWDNDEWFYCGIVLSVSKAGITLDEHAASLWSIECNYPGTDNSYLTQVSNELIEEAIAVAGEIVEKLKA